MPSETLISLSVNHFLNGSEKQKAPKPFSVLLGFLPGRLKPAINELFVTAAQTGLS